MTIKCSKTHVQRFVGLPFVICCYLVDTGHCCESSGADFMGLDPPPQYLSHGTRAIYQPLNNSQVKSAPLVLIPILAALSKTENYQLMQFLFKCK